MSEEMVVIEMRLKAMEDSMGKMEVAVTKGMDIISKAMVEVAVVMSKVQENTEQHQVIHRRIDEVHSETETQKEGLIELSTMYSTCCGSKVKPKDPVITALVISAYTLFGLSYIALIMLHGKDLINVVFH